MRFLGRLFPSFGGYRYTSPYFYTPPKKRWWPFLTGCALGGVVVLLIVGRSEQPADDNDYRVSVYQTRGSQTHKLTSKKISKSATERAQAQLEKPPVDVVTTAEAASNVPVTTPPETADQPTTPPPAADQSTRSAPTAGGEPDEVATTVTRKGVAHADARRNRDRHVAQKKSAKALARRHRRDRDQPAPAPEEQTFAMSGPQPPASGENYWNSGGDNWSAPPRMSWMSRDQSASASGAPLGGHRQRTVSASDWNRGGTWPNTEARSWFDNRAAAAEYEPAPSARQRAGRRPRSAAPQDYARNAPEDTRAQSIAPERTVRTLFGDGWRREP